MMPAINPRVNVVLEKPLYEKISHIARSEGVSLSLKVRDFVRQAVEDYEDAFFVKVASKREKSFRLSGAMKHGEIWAHLDRKTAR